MTSRSIDTTRRPESITANGRRDEVARIFARGLVQAARPVRSGMLARAANLEEGAGEGLDLPAETRLSVARRSARQRPRLRDPQKGARMADVKQRKPMGIQRSRVEAIQEHASLGAVNDW
jgi:hypothetical protein